MAKMVMDVDEALLATKLEDLHELLPDSGELLGLLESFVRTAGDGELVRINPVTFAQSHGCDEGALIDLFLHGRRVGLLRMEWHLRVPGLRRHRRELSVAHLGDGPLLLPGLQHGPRRRSQRLHRDHLQRLAGHQGVALSRPLVVEPGGILLRLPLHGERRGERRNALTRTPPAARCLLRVLRAGGDHRLRDESRSGIPVVHERTGADRGRRADGRDPALRLRLHRRAIPRIRGGDRRRPGARRVHQRHRPAIRPARGQPPGRLHMEDEAVPVRRAAALEPDVPRSVRVGDDPRRGGPRGEATRPAVHRYPGLDCPLRPHRRHEGVRPRPAALQLCA